MPLPVFEQASNRNLGSRPIIKVLKLFKMVNFQRTINKNMKAMGTKQINNIVGIDVSKKTFDTAIIKQMCKDQMEHHVFSNDAKGIRSFWKQLHQIGIKPDETLFCQEHTGIYGSQLLSFFSEHKCLIWLEMGTVIKKSMGLQRGKNDKVDACRIALYAYKNREDVKPWQPPRKQIIELRQLLGERDRLITCKNILEFPMRECRVSGNKDIAKKQASRSKGVITKIKSQIQQTERLLEKVISGDEELNEIMKLLTSIPGIGKITSYYLICYTNEFTKYKNARQLACYCGVVPFEHSSGTSIRGKSRVSHMANKRLKTLLHMGALAAIRDDEEIKRYYQRKVAQGKNRMLVINAVRNKLVHRISRVIQRKTPYLIKNEDLKTAA
jgi:transposase